MNSRHDHDKGSSRSTRDDSRSKGRWDQRVRERDHKRKSRSRSPRRRVSPPTSSKSSFHHDHERSSDSRERAAEVKKHQKSKWDSSSDSDGDVPAPPPPPNISFKPKMPIKMTLGATSKPTLPRKPTVASVFNADDDDEPEEMPAEAKMRMRNIGRETPTSAGPNSFGKTKQGFCDSKKVFEKNLKEALDSVEQPRTFSKLPQTIYKLKP